MRAKRPALAALAVAAPLLLVSPWLGGAWGAIGFSLAATLFPFALMALGIAGRGGWP